MIMEVRNHDLGGEDTTKIARLPGSLACEIHAFGNWLSRCVHGTFKVSSKKSSQCKTNETFEYKNHEYW